MKLNKKQKLEILKKEVEKKISPSNVTAGLISKLPNQKIEKTSLKKLPLGKKLLYLAGGCVAIWLVGRIFLSLFSLLAGAGIFVALVWWLFFRNSKS